MPLFLYALASFGFAFVVGYSKISLPLRAALQWASELHLVGGGDKIEDGDVVGYPKPIRFLAKWILALLECPACVGFWLGAASLFTPLADAIPFFAPWYFLAPFLGLANCGAVFVLGVMTGLIRTE